MKKVFKVILIVWAVLTIIGAPFYWPYLNSFITYNPIIIPARYPTPENATESRLQDLEYLRKLISYDRSFTDEEAALFTAEVDKLEVNAARMSDVEFYLGVSKAVALSNNGHTNVNSWPLYKKFSTIGVKLSWFADGLFITSAIEDYASLVGYRVIGVEGRGINVVLENLSRYTGGNAQWRKQYASMKIEFPEILHAAGLSASSTQIKLSLEDANGDRTDHVFKAVVVPEGYDNWVHALDQNRTSIPLYLQKQENPLYSSLSNNGFYIRTKSGFEPQDLPENIFYESALANIDDGELDYMVVDFRLNGGGNYMRSIDFAKAAPEKIKDGGKLYLIVGPRTFSAAIVTTAMLKYYGGKKSIIIGAPMGDNEKFWAETGMPFRLPNSGIQIFYATGYHDWNNGCDDHPYCFTMNRIHGVQAGSLQPVVLLEPKFSDYASGRDVVMNWIAAEQAER